MECLLVNHCLCTYADEGNEENEENEKWNKFIDKIDPVLGKLIMTSNSTVTF